MNNFFSLQDFPIIYLEKTSGADIKSVILRIPQLSFMADNF